MRGPGGRRTGQGWVLERVAQVSVWVIGGWWMLLLSCLVLFLCVCASSLSLCVSSLLPRSRFLLPLRFPLLTAILPCVRSLRPPCTIVIPRHVVLRRRTEGRGKGRKEVRRNAPKFFGGREQGCRRGFRSRGGGDGWVRTQRGKNGETDYGKGTGARRTGRRREKKK